MLRNLPVAALLSVVAMLAVSCSTDVVDGEVTTLPEGMYPLTLTATQDEMVALPQTRVSDYDDTDGTHKSKWTAGDQIKVVVSEGNNDAETTCTLDANGDITTCSPALYWKTTQMSKINAWYSNITGQNTTSNTVSLADQSSGLAYVLKADEKSNVNYQSGNISLDFKHQLAKVRVTVNKGTYTGDLNNLSVAMQECYTSCIVTNGIISNPQGSGDIKMRSVGNNVFEANVVPGKTSKDNAFKINADDKTSLASLSGAVTFTAGSVHYITIKIDATGPIPITPDETITQPGDYIMKGSFTQGVILNGNNINLIVEEASSTAATAIHVKGGTPAITVKGTNNSFNCSDTPILLDPKTNVIIKGSTSNPKDSKLTIRTSTSAVAGIGSASESSCGNISIADITLDVYGGTGSDYGGAAIGTNGAGSFGSSCGNITIENSVVYAKGGIGAAAIGLAEVSDSNSCGEIIIKHSKIYATTTYDDYYNSYAACIGHAAFAERTPVVVGKITITTDESKEVFFGADRFKAIDNNGSTVTSGFYKVGKSNSSNYQSKQTWSGVYFGKEGQETELASGSTNGYQ